MKKSEETAEHKKFLKEQKKLDKLAKVTRKTLKKEKSGIIK